MILRADVSPIRLVYRRPIRLRGETISHRDGFVLRVEDSLGRVGYGEALAWPGDDLSALGKSLEAACAILTGTHTATNFPSLSPSAAFAMDTAGCDLAAAASGLPRRKLLNLAAGAATRVNGFIDFDALNAVAVLDQASARGLRCLKLKLGRANFGEDLELVSAVRARFPEIVLRADVNGAWSESEAIERLHVLAPFRFDYIEEPVSGIDALLRLAAASPVRLAVDESLSEAQPCDPSLVRILKPVRLGSFSNTKAAIAGARDAVITGAFDGPIATLMAAEMAAAWLPSRTAHGLDVAALYDSPLSFQGDVLSLDTPFSRFTGSYEFAAVST